jgi:intracellular septation protein
MDLKKLAHNTNPFLNERDCYILRPYLVSITYHYMRLLFDFLPIVVFFIAYKLFGIYTATAAAIIISLLQVISYWIKHRSVPSIQLISLVLILFFGGGTLLLHNELLIKWKPTALYWLLACAAFVTQYFGKKPMIQHLLETNIVLPSHLWSTLNRNWIIFFALMGDVNLWVAYSFDTNTWVNFKLFGLLGITFVFIVIQAIYLARYIRSDEKT